MQKELRIICTAISLCKLTGVVSVQQDRTPSFQPQKIPDSVTTSRLCLPEDFQLLDAVQNRWVTPLQCPEATWNMSRLTRKLKGLRQQSTLHSETSLTESGNASQLGSMYGSRPIIHGLPTCSRYKSRVPASFRKWSIAGLFNTGNLTSRASVAWCLRR